MPFRDHFRPPLDNSHSWDEMHGQWPAMIVLSLAGRLPRRFVAAPQIHLGSNAQVDVAAFEEDARHNGALFGSGDQGGVATATWAPPRSTLKVASDLPSQEEYEVRVYDAKRGRRLVAAIEIVSPANKDRPEHRRAFAAKCVALLQQKVSVTIVDLVTIRAENLYGEMLDMIGQSDPALAAEPPATYAVACRATKPDAKPGTSWQLETWLNPLIVGQPLPTLPLWLADNLAIPLELEASYEDTCRVLRIA